MKKIPFIGLPVVVLVFFLTLVACPTDSGNDDDTIKIRTAAQLDAIRDNLGGHYVLEADINLASYTNWEPIGQFVPLSDEPEDQETPKLELAFTGIFDGNGHKISNVVISDQTELGVGLFGCVAGDNGVVKNLVVENATVTGTMLVGGVIGYAQSGNLIEKITLRGINTITGNNLENGMVGGMVGGGFGDIKNCSANAAVILNGSIGMGGILAGGMEDGSFISCSATGSVTVGSGAMIGIGGLAACGQNAAEITDCTADVTITVQAENCIMIGGLLGYTGRYAPDAPTAISACTVRADITVPASAERVGGLVGSGFYSGMFAFMSSMPGYEFLAAPNAFKVTNSSTSGSITGGCTDLVGKIAGYIYDNSTVESSCTSTMTINGSAGAQTGGDKNSAGLDTLN
ncbi:MAG: hypothetical protein LBC51_03345 [Treponema sp.]|jgi:hypothetical protein|nr:hypothetical protein [Treponema sp.]